MDQDTRPIPREPGVIPDDDHADPAPERDLSPAAPADPRDRGGTGEPVGTDNIREGRVGGVLGGPRRQQGQGQVG